MPTSATTSRAALRPLAAPALLLAGAAALLLGNDVPAAEASRRAAGAVAGWPVRAQHAVTATSEGGLVLLAVVLAAVLWRARARGPRQVATGVVGGVGAVLALAVSELVKVLVAQDRPCRTVPGLDAVAGCPALGDWSLPSNHATIAAALAAAVVWSAPRWWPLPALLAVAVAASRVGLGVHHPHDVVDGLVLGVVVVSLAVVTSRTTVTRWVAAGAGVPLLGRLLDARPGRPTTPDDAPRPVAGPATGPTAADR